MGGGVAVWYFTRPKDDDTTPIESPEDTGVTGRTDYTNSLLDGEVIDSNITDPTQSSMYNPNNTAAPEKTLYIRSNEAQQMILQMSKDIATNPIIVGKLRARIQSGHIFTDGVKYTTDAQEAIEEMFEKFAGVTPGNPTTYPIYSTWESQGKAIRDDLQDFINKGWERLNLSNIRAGGNPEYLESLDLNLYYLKRHVWTHSADQIWWHQADREGLDNFKEVNGHDVGDRRLVEKTNGRGSFPAGGSFNFAKDWIAEIDRLDLEVKKEAKIRLEQLGWTFSLTPITA